MADSFKPTDPNNEDAPFGHNDDGSPLAPYGFKVNGKPKITNRGRKTGTTGISTRQSATTTKAKARDEHDKQRKSSLLLLTNTFITTPLAGMSTSVFIEKRLGVKQTDALAGDAVIVDYFAPSLADGLIAASQQNPGMLSWLDSVEEKAPWIMLAQVGLQMTKAIVGNHSQPNADIAQAGRRLARMNVAKMAQMINDEAAAMGIPTDDEISAAMRADATADAA